MNYQIPVIVVLILLIIAVFLYKRLYGKETLKGKKKKGKGKKTTKKGKSVARSPRHSNTSEPDEEGDEDPDLVADSRELFDLVHGELAGGMQLDEFEDLVGDLAGENPEEVYLQLKQLYNQSMDKNMDPTKTVTLSDYIDILEQTD